VKSPVDIALDRKTQAAYFARSQEEGAAINDLEGWDMDNQLSEPAQKPLKRGVRKLRAA
jgi:hypothetical protein